jgi:hypothetical protein
MKRIDHKLAKGKSEQGAGGWVPAIDLQQPATV